MGKRHGSGGILRAAAVTPLPRSDHAASLFSYTSRPGAARDVYTNIDLLGGQPWKQDSQGALR
jgi:hypothetical protein